MATLSPAIPASAGKVLRAGLWLAQGLLFLAFCGAGFVKLTTPIAALSAMMPWTAQVAEPFVRIIALIDLAGGIGILLPALTRIKPRLTVLAALGCTALQMLAITFHVWRGEFHVLPLNVVLISLSAFVLWGRLEKAPVAAR